MDTLLADHWILVPLVFFARVLDVSIGTVRTILAVRRHRFVAAGLGFCEILIWVVAAGQVIQNLDVWYLAVAYAAGFATGNFVGIWLENRLALGSELVRAISANREVRLADTLRGHGHDVIELAGTRAAAPVEVLLVVEKRRTVPQLLGRIAVTDPQAVCTISDVRPHVSRPLRQPPAGLWPRFRHK